jgi:hypothetical protein
METPEAKSAIKALFLQSATLAGFEVGPMCPEELLLKVQSGITVVKRNENRRPEAVANLLRLVAATLESAQERGDKILHEENVREANEKICPIYPFK